jgi:hypothetical protein
VSKTFLPCPKCCSTDTELAYCSKCHNPRSPETPWSMVCTHPEPQYEHFHRTCNRCGYQWLTNDVHDPQVVCPWPPA